MNFKKYASVLFCFGLFFSLATVSVLAQSSSSSSSSSSNDDDTNPYNSYSGVRIDARGVLSREATYDVGRVSQQQIMAAKSSYSLLPKNVMKSSPIRYVSLNRLEKAIVDNQGVVTEDMKYLVGLQRIRYVFYFPETKDIVIAGPAEGWFPGFEGAMIGQTTLAPVCELQDLVVALRAYAPGKEGAPVVGCSIDPTAEGNAQLQQFIKNFGPRNGPGREEQFVIGLRKSLGLQTIRVDGIPADTHAAVVMVAADYRMKRIGIGVEPSPVGIRTFISEVNPARQAGNALFRWFFVPDYQSVVMTADKSGMEMTGEGVKLVAEDEIVNVATGERTVKKGKVDGASRTFTNSFTKEYPKLAQKSLVFAQLRTFIDMLVASAHIQQQDFYGKAGWSMEFLGNEEKFAVQTVSAATAVEPVVGIRRHGGLTMFPIGGGVEIEPEIALKAENVKIEDKQQVSGVQSKVKIDLQPGQWWWD